MLRHDGGPSDACGFCQTLADRHAQVTRQMRYVLIPQVHSLLHHPGEWAHCPYPPCAETRTLLDPPRRRA